MIFHLAGRKAGAKRAEARLRDLLRVGPGEVDLTGIDPGGTPGLPDTKAVRHDPKRWARAELAEIGAEMSSGPGWPRRDRYETAASGLYEQKMNGS
jgi:hypothetical protein